jgi:hypothetical protein
MKVLNYFVSYAAVSIIPILFVITCTKEAALVNHTSGLETANIVGKIRNDDGAIANGVSIKLIPTDFDPHATIDLLSIDSTETDGNGMYGFKLKSTGFFNVSAHGFGKYCYLDSVYGSERDRFTVKDDTLKPAGSISGIARLQAGGDNRQIIILVIGTNTYATPQDSSGTFSIAAIAQGAYKLRMLTLEKGYGIFDTTVNVKSGENTAIAGVLRLPVEAIPAIGQVSANYDPRMMRVKLTWPPCDTANIDSVYVFRNTGIAEPPYALLDKKDTSFEEDILFLNPDSLRFGDTLRYSVAACGKNHAIGSVGVAPDILIKSIFTPIGSFLLSGLSRKYDGDDFEFVVDKAHNIYFGGDGWVSKVDPAGRVCADYGDHDASNIYYLSIIKTDTKGNVYYYSLRDTQLIRLSTNLKLTATKIVSNAGLLTIDVDSKGMVYIFSETGGQSLSVTVLDSTLTVVDSSIMDPKIVGNCIFPQQIRNDTIDFLPCLMEGTAYFKAQGIHFSTLQTIDTREMLSGNCPFPLEKARLLHVDFAAGGKSLLNVTNKELFLGQKLIFGFDAASKMTGRCHLQYDLHDRYHFDGIDRLYLYREAKQSIAIYKINW